MPLHLPSLGRRSTDQANSHPVREFVHEQKGMNLQREKGERKGWSFGGGGQYSLSFLRLISQLLIFFFFGEAIITNNPQFF